MMAAKIMKSAFMTGVHYLNHIQYSGENCKGMQMINRRLEFGNSLFNKDLYAHYGCVNAVEFSNDGEWLVSGGDDKRVLLWNVDKALSSSYEPKMMKGEHNSNIFCLGFNASHSKLFSAGNDEQVILHDVNTAEILDVFLDDEAVYGLSVDPNNENIFLSACDGGRVLLWDIRQISRDPITLASCPSAFHSVMYNPVETQYVATGNAKDGVCLWDIRKPKVSVMKYGPSKGAMSVRFNSTGTHIIALRRRLPPVLYDVTSGQPAAEFDHPEYYNSCTMKSCCFAGDRDQYVLSGSDDFKLYVWKVPENLSPKKRAWINKAHFILRGHRSIVNQVRYNHSYGILASSGVEKIIKLWSSFQLSNKEALNNYVTSSDVNRKVYTHEEYISLVLESGQFMTHDYSHHSVQEDPRMMAFFDSLVQRDIEGWTSDSVDASDVLSTCFEVQSSDSSDSSSSSSSTSSTESDDEQPSSGNVVTSAANVLYAYQNTQYLRPITLMFSPTAKETATKKSETTETDPSSSVDRISQLIAQKRRETKLKAARATMSRKDFKAMKSRIKKSKSSTTSKSKLGVKKNKTKTFTQLLQKGSHSYEESEPKTLTLSLAKDKRKMLLKKRAKLVKEAAAFMNSSSESDSNTEESELKCNVENKDDQKVKDNVVNRKLINAEKTSVSLRQQHSDENSKDAVLPKSSSDNLNANETNANDTLVSFSTKNGKHNKRNYRKRSAEDIDDD